MPHLFEFMDQDWLPDGLRATLHEILECGCSRPFRSYYQWVAKQVAATAVAAGCENIVELGAGSAPISRLLVDDLRLEGIRLVVCDSHPDTETFADLQRKYPERIIAIFEPVDFSVSRSWPPKTLLFLSGTFHHVAPECRQPVLENLTRTADQVVVVEPLRKRLSSMLFVFGSTIPALLLPAWFFRRPGKLRRPLWCWLVPIAPVLFWWEGQVSCLRMWSDDQWRTALAKLQTPAVEVTIKHSLFSQLTSWQSSATSAQAESPHSTLCTPNAIG